MWDLPLHRVPKDWIGEPVAIVASGCSVRDFDFSLIEGMKTIAVKDGFRLCPHADILMIGDHRYARRTQDLSGYKGPLILYTDPDAPLPTAFRDERVQFIPKVAGRGLSRKRVELKGTFTTTNLAINVAVLRGSKLIFLVGVDGKAGPKGERHFCNQTAETWHKRYQRQKWGYQRIVQDLKGRGVRVYNVNPDSDVKSFPTISPDNIKRLL